MLRSLLQDGNTGNRDFRRVVEAGVKGERVLVDRAGFCSIEDLERFVICQGLEMDFRRIARVISDDAGERFTARKDGDGIITHVRANQGHTDLISSQMDDEEAFESIEFKYCPPVLYSG